MKDRPLSKEEALLAKRYPVFFTTFPRRAESSNGEGGRQESESGSDSRNTDNGQDSLSLFYDFGLGEIFGMDKPNTTFPT
jgi:hypothetical protein